MTLYEYTALVGTDIRLLHLEPGNLNDDICFRISHVTPVQPLADQSLDLQLIRDSLPKDWWVYEEISRKTFFYYEDANGVWKSQWTHPDSNFDLRPYEIGQRNHRQVFFEALSYTWGNPENPAIAYVQTQGGVKTIPIGRELEGALRQLRYPRRQTARTLWVDALCINQADDEEKNKQVARMSFIYKEASRVIVWLGKTTDNSKLAMETLSFLGSQVVISVDKWNFAAPGASETNWCMSNQPLPYNEQTWNAIRALLQRPWFSRVWIVQEVHLARRAVVICGDDETPWENLIRAITTLDSKNTLGTVQHTLPRQLVRFTERLVAPIRPSSSIFHILERTHGRGCRDAKDLIYGVLGLFPPAYRRKIEPSYNLTLGAVYTDFVKSHIEHVSRLEMLRLCELGGRSGGNMPSWVPDFAASRLTAKMADWQFCAGYSACHVSYEGNVLRASGSCVGPVVKVTPRILNYRVEERVTFYDCIETIRRVCQMASVVEGQKWSKRMLLTLVGGYVKDKFVENSICTSEQLASILPDSPIFGGCAIEEVKLDRLTFLEHRCLEMLLGRRLFWTMDGSLGLGPPEIAEGDIVVCLLGCDSPMVLREAEKKGHFLVVGECFLQPCNDLEGLLGPIPHPWRVQFFMENLDRAGVYRYYDEETTELSDHEPRLKGLPSSLTLAGAMVRGGDDPITMRIFKNEQTGEIHKSDPRLTPRKLGEIGILLDDFRLV